MKKNIKKIVGVIACVTLLCAMTGCAMLDSAINDLKGNRKLQLKRLHHVQL